MYSFIELLRALAVLLITNSHFDGVYPWDISWGGCPGLCLFFVITGFLLVRGVKGNFFPWWLKKLIRLYIPMTIVNIIMVIIGFRKPSFILFLFPIEGLLWYVPVICLLYIPYFIVLYLDKNKKPEKLKGGYRAVAIAAAVIAYTVLYILRYRNEFFAESEVAFRAIYGFIAMMLGSYAYDGMKKTEDCGKGPLFIAGAVLCCGGFIVTKLLVNRVSIVMYFQFMTQVFSVAFALLALLAGICYEKKLKGLMNTLFGKGIGLISQASLEIYLLQFVIIRSFRGLVFPLNMLIIIAVILASAFLVHFVSDRLTKAVNGLLFKDKKASGAKK